MNASSWLRTHVLLSALILVVMGLADVTALRLDALASEIVEIPLHELADPVVGPDISFDLGRALGEVLAVRLQLQGEYVASFWWCAPYPFYGYDYGDDYLYVGFYDQDARVVSRWLALGGATIDKVVTLSENQPGWSFLQDGQAMLRFSTSTGEPEVVVNYGSHCEMESEASVVLTNAVLIIEFEPLVSTFESSWGMLKARFQ